MGWFGPSKDEVWRQLSQEIGAEFVEGGFWKGSKVQAHVGPWTVTLDTYTVDTGARPRHLHPDACPLRQSRGLPVHDLPQGVLQRPGQAPGHAGHRGGRPRVRRGVHHQGERRVKVRELFADPKIRPLILAQPKIRLEVKDSEGWFGPTFPEDVDELHFQVVGVIKDVERLKALFDLFAAVLDRLCRIGSLEGKRPK